jgi:hypothetical protein
MQVTRSAVNAWLSDPVTLVYLEAIKEGRDDWADSVLRGDCKSADPNSTSERYHFHLGVLEAYDNCLTPMDVLVTHDKVVKEEDNDKPE